MPAHRRIAALLISSCLSPLLLSAAACSSDRPDRAAVVAKIRADPDMADAPEAVVDCIADWYTTDASDKAREAFLAGEAPPESAGPEILECLKKAT
ncbi:hypothetical protein AB0G04_09125 [Actinoplanes sp. NPDC023801]|uniref:hypothetical protein n=1 Tax=Actinoplanes sp. NPDC023801 TaxID=3154595 RepID=UPI0033EA86F3